MEKSSILQFLSANQWIIPIIVVWTLIWKGLALWKAARNRSLVWFIAILIINTLGILEIIYIFLISKEKTISEETPKKEAADEIKGA